MISVSERQNSSQIQKICMFESKIMSAIYNFKLEVINFIRLKKIYHPENHFSPNRTPVRQSHNFKLNFQKYLEIYGDPVF